MRKSLASLVLAASMALVGCGEESKSIENKSNESAIEGYILSNGSGISKKFGKVVKVEKLIYDQTGKEVTAYYTQGEQVRPAIEGFDSSPMYDNRVFIDYGDGKVSDKWDFSWDPRSGDTIWDLRKRVHRLEGWRIEEAREFRKK